MVLTSLSSSLLFALHREQTECRKWLLLKVPNHPHTYHTLTDGIGYTLIDHKGYTLTDNLGHNTHDCAIHFSVTLIFLGAWEEGVSVDKLPTSD